MVVPAPQLLPRLDRERHLVPLRRQRAGRIRGEHAGRVVGLVEVDRYRALAGLGWVGVDETAAAVGALAVGLVAEDEEELAVAFVDGLKADVVAVAGEEDLARGVGVLGGAEDVGHRDLGSLGRRLEARLHHPVAARRVVVEALGAGADGALAVLYIYRPALAARDDVELDRAERDDSGLALGVAQQLRRLRHRLLVDRERRAGCRRGGRLPAVGGGR